jgi:hypothetical protein
MGRCFLVGNWCIVIVAFIFFGVFRFSYEDGELALVHETSFEEARPR